jgi:hypothetical protein
MNWNRLVVPVSALLLLASSALSAQKVKVGYHKEADFTQYKTYAWMGPVEATNRPVLAMHIRGAIEEELNKKGLQKVESNPDLLLNAGGGLGALSAAPAGDPMWAAYGGYPPPEATMWGGALPALSAMVLEGHLNVVLVDAAKKQLVWQAQAKTNLDYEHKEKAFSQINKAVVKMFEKFPPNS